MVFYFSKRENCTLWERRKPAVKIQQERKNLSDSFRQSQQNREVVDITALKILVSEKFPNDSTLREIITEDRDCLKTDDFLSKMEIWLKLLRRIKN